MPPRVERPVAVAAVAGGHDRAVARERRIGRRRIRRRHGERLRDRGRRRRALRRRRRDRRLRRRGDGRRGARAAGDGEDRERDEEGELRFGTGHAGEGSAHPRCRGGRPARRARKTSARALSAGARRRTAGEVGLDGLEVVGAHPRGDEALSLSRAEPLVGVPGLAEERLHLGDRARRALHDVHRPRQRERDARAVLRHVVDEPNRARLHGADLVPGEEEARRRRGADEREEPRERAPRRREPHARLLEADLRAVLGDAQVARERELGAAADGRPGERGDDGDVERHEPAAHLAPGVGEALGVALRARGAELAQVGARHEHRALAGQDHGAERAVLRRLPDGAVELRQGGVVEGVLQPRAREMVQMATFPSRSIRSMG